MNMGDDCFILKVVLAIN